MRLKKLYFYVIYDNLIEKNYVYCDIIKMI